MAKNSISLAQGIGSLSFTFGADGTIKINYPGMNTISIAPGTYRMWYLDESTKPATFVDDDASAPDLTVFNYDQWLNNGTLALSVALLTKNNYIIGNGDLRPVGNLTEHAYNIDNANTASLWNYVIVEGTIGFIQFAFPQ
jgi:hypothetical protein